MSSPEARIGVQFIEGFKVTVKPVESTKIIPGSVANHEAKHIVAAITNGTGVKKATIVPGEGCLGLTELTRPDAIAAAAPHATGCDGTGHDVFIIGLMGHDVNAVSNAAREIIQIIQKRLKQ